MAGEIAMPRPLFDSEYLYGFHDPGGEHIMLEQGIPGWVLITKAIGRDLQDMRGDDFSVYSGKGLGVMVRLNHGYGGLGTIPIQDHYHQFAQRCANYVRSSTGARIWIIGNETNHPIEWPGAEWDWSAAPPRPRNEDKYGEAITPNAYARCYRLVRDAIHAVPGHEGDLVLVAAAAPWNPLTTYPSNRDGDWVQYFRDILEELGPQVCDGITIHTYTHGADPGLIRSERRVGAPRFSEYNWDFRAYRDFMQAIPDDMQHLPVFITETNQGDEPWRDHNSGWVKAAYGEIDDWNQNNSQKIRSLLLYRWPKIDQWAIDGKSGLIEDFREALNFKYKWLAETEAEDRPEETPLQRLEGLEAQFDALSPLVGEANGLMEALDQQMTSLLALDQKLEDADMLHANMTVLASAIEELEQELMDLQTPTDDESNQRLLPDILDVSLDLPQRTTDLWDKREIRHIRRIVLHHTATRTDVSPEHIAEVHIGQGKPGIAYHYLVTGDGIIYATQPLTNIVRQITSSDDNATINADSVAVAFAGDFRASRNVEPADEQRFAAAHLIAWLTESLGLGADIAQIVFGRSELGEVVTSPGDQWLNGVRYKDKLLADVKTALASDTNIGGSQELLRLQMLVANLETVILQLQANADQVEPLLDEIDHQRTTIQEQTDQIESLQIELEQRSGEGRRPDIIDIVETLPSHPDLPPYKIRTQPVSKLVIHHTDTPKNFPVERIAQYHVYGSNARKDPWPGIGYHYVIAADGTIYWTQRHETRSYHVGAGNSYCLGISLIGRFLQTGYDKKPQAPEDQLPTHAQMESTARLVAWLMRELRIDSVQQVVGHKEVGATACPGDQWLRGVRWKDDLLGRIQSEMTDKSLVFYLLFWDHGDNWASADWQNARDYIAHFRPTVGFSVDDALHAQHVLIVGGPAGVSGGDEALLRAAGVDVHRLAGIDEAETKAMLDELVSLATPWPGAPVIATALPPTAEPESDAWTIPDDFIAPSTGDTEPLSIKIRVETSLFPPPLDDDGEPQEKV